MATRYKFCCFILSLSYPKEDHVALIKRSLALLTLITTFQLTQASEREHWSAHFYTDDSHYYQRVHHDGFEQIFRVHKDHCHAIASAQIITKSTIHTPNAIFQKAKDISSWPAIYGLNYDQWCWFEVRVKGLDLNRLDMIHYLIEITDTQGLTLYFEGETDSLLPQNRLTQNPTHWMTPGSMGANPVVGGGFFFKLWEPFAEEVHLFIDDEKRAVLKTKEPVGKNLRIHTFFDPSAKLGQTYHYQFIKNGEYELVEANNRGDFCPVKIDPFAREITYDKKGGSINSYHNPRGILASPFIDHQWQFDDKIQQLSTADYNNWIIYQLWPLAFNPQEKDGQFQVGTFNDILPKLDYLDGLGITAIEFLPVHESRFNASWGYALDSLILIEQGLGTRHEFAYLVDRIHQREIKVILDVVINHVNNFLIRDPLTATVNRSKYYGGDTEWGPKPDFENIMVQKWIADSLINLARDFHIDGYRWDMIEHVYKDSERGYRFLQELITLLRSENQRFYSSAEQLPDNVWATFPIEQGGLGFDSQWNDKFKNFFELEFDFYRAHNRNVDISPLIGSLRGMSNHRHQNGEYAFGEASRMLNYLGSHDVVGNKNPILRIVSDFHSTEWVGDTEFFRVRPLEEEVATEKRFRQIHNPFTHSVSMAGHGVLFSAPGAMLFFQGEEFGQDINIENEWSYVSPREGNTIPTKDVDVDRFVRSHRVPWEYLDTRNYHRLSFLTESEHRSFDGLRDFIAEMTQWRANNPEVGFELAKNVNFHGNSTVSYQISSAKADYFVIVNFGNRKEETWIPFPASQNAWWHEIISTTQPRFHIQDSQFQNIIPLLGGRSNLVRLEGTSFSLFEKKTRPTVEEDLYLMSELSNWQASEKMKLTVCNVRPHILQTNIELELDDTFEFKIATQDWSVEMGSASHPVTVSSRRASTGQLSYLPNRANETIELKKGHYVFEFDLKTFKYTFRRR